MEFTGPAAPGLDSTAVLIGYTIETAMDVTRENDAEEITGPGVYFVRIRAGQFAAANKMLRMK